MNNRVNVELILPTKLVLIKCRDGILHVKFSLVFSSHWLGLCCVGFF